MAQVNKTIHPLHFEDLEPKRFEDLIRQLIYDFRNWRQLEATGRAGSDDGFDARGWEIVNVVSNNEPEQEDQEQITQSEDRIWLVQCKREQQIAPKKLGAYLDGIFKDKEQLHGIIFAAPCEFSKKSKDLFREKCIKYGIVESYLWGKAELEDMLFQPKNDHLLFAYFGFSLTIRQRSHKTQIRSILTMKRQVQKHLHRHDRVLLRNVADIHYPYKRDCPGFDKHPQWQVFDYLGEGYRGIKLLLKSYFAYVAEDRIHWDYIEDSEHNRVQDPWADKPTDDQKIFEYRNYWQDLPQNTQACYEIWGELLYEQILAIDEMGDKLLPQTPHLYVDYEKGNSPFNSICHAVHMLHGNGEIEANMDNRINFFSQNIEDCS